MECGGIVGKGGPPAAGYLGKHGGAIAMVRLAEIWTYPVKSLRGAAHGAADLELCGLAGDRRWMVVDGNGRFYSQRDFPSMATVGARDCLLGLV